MRFDILTLFPDLFNSYLEQSLLKQALDKGLLEIHRWNFREWASGKHQSVDDRPFGGGPGMLLSCEPVFECIEHVQQQGTSPGHLVMLTPQGRKLTQTVVQELAGKSRLILLCGRYEGFDERISLGLQPDEISVGDFIVNGGEVPAMVIIESVMRLIPGVLGDETSSKYESFAEAGMLEYPQYTRPREYRGMTVPEVLLTGNHQEIEKWRERAAYERTVERREDLAGKLPPLPEPKRKKAKKKKQTNEFPATGTEQTAASAPGVDKQKTEPPKTTDEPLT
ncbi:MAG: tRNA (guanosine(37)-N1)-methyltransferase TrmD [Planctomycetaceae bacterium]|nr:tRNA (guanosine(37)-N1)-methyltransferase TrmD [Planctomycetaceae bacterium]